MLSFSQDKEAALLWYYNSSISCHAGSNIKRSFNKPKDEQNFYELDTYKFVIFILPSWGKVASGPFRSLILLHREIQQKPISLVSVKYIMHMSNKNRKTIHTSPLNFPEKKCQKELAQPNRLAEWICWYM